MPCRHEPDLRGKARQAEGEYSFSKNSVEKQDAANLLRGSEPQNEEGQIRQMLC